MPYHVSKPVIAIKIETLIQWRKPEYLLYFSELLGKRRLIMKKIAKLLCTSVLLALSLSIFAYSGTSTDLDSFFKNNEFKLPALDSSYHANYSEPVQDLASQNKEDAYTLQFDAVANFDVAQARRAKLRIQTGYNIQMTFDAPFYKLRGGYFKKKSEAEDKARELSLYNISAFPVKVK